MFLTALMSGLDLASKAAKRHWKVHKTVLSLLHQHCSTTICSMQEKMLSRLGTYRCLVLSSFLIRHVVTVEPECRWMANRSKDGKAWAAHNSA